MYCYTRINDEEVYNSTKRGCSTIDITVAAMFFWEYSILYTNEKNHMLQQGIITLGALVNPLLHSPLCCPLSQGPWAELPEGHELQAIVAAAVPWQHAEPSSVCTQKFF